MAKAASMKSKQFDRFAKSDNDKDDVKAKKTSKGAFGKVAKKPSRKRR